MQDIRLNLEVLVDEYRTLVAESRSSDGPDLDWDRLKKKLQDTAGWTEDGAGSVADLARVYGAFVLRNALALTVAADIEDGELAM